MAKSNKRSYSSLEISFESLLYRAFSEYAAPRDEYAFARCASSRAISIACVESYISRSRALSNMAGPPGAADADDQTRKQNDRAKRSKARHTQLSGRDWGSFEGPFIVFTPVLFNFSRSRLEGTLRVISKNRDSLHGFI